MSETPPQAPDVDGRPGITILQIFLERLSFEHRENTLKLPPTPTATVGDVSVTAEFGTVSDDKSIGVTRLTVTTKPENAPVYNVVVSMVGVFGKEPGVEGMPLDTFLENNSVAILYPFVREAFANVTQRGKFGPVYLNPFNTLCAWKAVPTTTERPPSGG